MQQPEHKTSGSGIEAVGGDLKKKSGAVQQEHEEKPASKAEQGEEQQKKNVQNADEQSLPTAKDAVDFLPFRRSVMETDASLE